MGRSIPDRIARPAHAHRTALAIAIGLDFKGERFTLRRLASIAREGADMDKDVLSAVIGHDKTKAAFGIPFLEFAAIAWLIHASLPLHWRAGAVLIDFVGSILGAVAVRNWQAMPHHRARGYRPSAKMAPTLSAPAFRPLPMLSSLQNLLTSFFHPDDAADAHSEAKLQLATAVLLFDVMRSDADTNDAERAQAMAVLRQRFGLSDEALAALMAQAEQTAVHANDYFSFTSLMNDQFTQPQKIQVVEFMWQVAYADGALDANEHHIISKVAGLLHVTHGEYIAAKMRAKEAALLAAQTNAAPVRS